MNELSLGDYGAQRQADKDLLVDFLDYVWSRGDVASCDNFIADTYTIHNDPGDPWHGQTLDIDGFKDRLLKSRAPFPDQRFDIQDMVAEPGRVAVSWLWEGTFLQDFAGFKASGQVLKMSGLTIYSVLDGKLSGHWQLCDRLGVFQQLQGQPG